MNYNILYTACVTPFSQDGQAVDYGALNRLIQEQEQAGNGLVLLGSTGEALSLSLKERQEVLEAACGHKIELIVGVPSHNFSEALAWIEYCNSLPIKGYLLTTPMYTKPGVMGQTRWFEALLDKAHHKAILYNIPGRAAVSLHPATLKKLAQHPRLCAIKDSGGSLEHMVEYQLTAPHIPIYCGDDYLMPAMAAEGAVGLISVASNVWPKAVRRYVATSLLPRTIDPSLLDKGSARQSPAQGTTDSEIKLDTERESLDKRWWKACRALFTASNPIPVKALLKAVGKISHDSVRLPLCRQDLHTLQELLDSHATIQPLEEIDYGS